ncbi:MAG: hypothetical protein K2P81_10915 [Bacteriovoracaceae bacterium]|nr:hypothetical protein [Bacteriovoracaceae bacterium]
MMQKNWLIRTKSNHILGPVSKEKVLELYHNGSIRPEDEICSGNGYWFFLREKDQVDLYLLGSQKQCFNPISEAKDVLTATGHVEIDKDRLKDVTIVGGIDISSLNAKPSAPKAPPAAVTKPVERAAAPAKAAPVAKAEIDEEPEPAAPIPLRPKASVTPSPTPVAPGKPKKKESEAAPEVPKSKVSTKKKLMNDKVVMVSTVLILVVLAGVLYFRKRILKEFIQGAVQTVIPAAYAQDPIKVEAKKKVFFNL